jgi:cytochrome P450
MSSEVEQRHIWPFRRNDPLLPPPLFDEIRAECPVTRVELWDGSGAWLVTRSGDMKELLRSSAVSADSSRSGYPNASRNHDAARSNQKGFIRMDKPEHALRRRMLVHAFSPGRLGAMEPFLEELVDRLLDKMEAAGTPADLMKYFAGPLPSEVICEMLDLPRSDSDYLLETVDAWMDLNSCPEVSAKAASDLNKYVDDLLVSRSANLGDDLVSTLIRDQVDRNEVTRDDLIYMIALLILGGFDTTTNMIALGTVVLFRHPEQMDYWRAHPEIAPAAVEELLRYLSISHQVAARVATADLNIGNTCIPSGDGVLAPIPAANHDPDVFPDPHRFDIRRDSSGHVAFGYGPHQCLGQNLARIELRIAFTKLLTRFPNLHLAVDENDLEFRNAMNIGITALPVSW